MSHMQGRDIGENRTLQLLLLQPNGEPTTATTVYANKVCHALAGNRLSHGDKLFGRGWMNTHRGVKGCFGGTGF